jgi:DNA polymerase-3 subunit alpha
VAVGEKPPEVARLLREFSARRESTEDGELQHGLRVRLGLRCTEGQEAAVAELQLGEAYRTYPTDAALAAWRAQAAGGDAVVVYE